MDFSGFLADAGCPYPWDSILVLLHLFIEDLLLWEDLEVEVAEDVHQDDQRPGDEAEDCYQDPGPETIRGLLTAEGQQDVDD